MIPKYIYVLIYFISVIIGILNFKKIKGTKVSYFLYILILGLITESLGYYIGYYTQNRNTFPIYNTYYGISFSIYFLFYKSFIKSKIEKKLIMFFLISFLIFGIINYTFIQTSFFNFQLNTFIYGTFCFIVIINIYLFDILNSDVILNIKYVLLFWISIGNLLFFIGWLPVFVLSKYLNYDGIWDYITLTLNIIMHICFILGFLLTKKDYNT